MVDAIGYGDWAFKVHPGRDPRRRGGGLVQPLGVGAGGRDHRRVPAAGLPGRAPAGRRWRWVAYVCAFAVAVSVLDWLVPGPMTVTGFPDHDNPFGVQALDAVLRPLQPSSADPVLLGRRRRQPGRPVPPRRADRAPADQVAGGGRRAVRRAVLRLAGRPPRCWRATTANTPGWIARRAGRVVRLPRADPDRDRHRRAPLPPVRDRRDHPPDADLRDAGRRAGGALPGRRRR